MIERQVELTIDGFRTSKGKTIPYEKVFLYIGDNRVEIIPEIISEPNQENDSLEIRHLKSLRLKVKSRIAYLIARELG